MESEGFPLSSKRVLGIHQHVMWLESGKVASEREMHDVIRAGKAESKTEMRNLGSISESSSRKRDS